MICVSPAGRVQAPAFAPVATAATSKDAARETELMLIDALGMSIVREKGHDPGRRTEQRSCKGDGEFADSAFTAARQRQGSQWCKDCDQLDAIESGSDACRQCI